MNTAKKPAHSGWGKQALSALGAHAQSTFTVCGILDGTLGIGNGIGNGNVSSATVLTDSGVDGTRFGFRDKTGFFYARPSLGQPENRRLCALLIGPCKGKIHFGCQPADDSGNGFAGATGVGPAQRTVAGVQKQFAYL